LKTRIKICGITNPRDAHLAYTLGADHIGLIFTESPRRVTPALARLIRITLPKASLVGVFRDDSVERIERVSGLAGLDRIQLHGAESPAFCRLLRTRLGKPVIKVLDSSALRRAQSLDSFHGVEFFVLDLDKGLDGASRREAQKELWRCARTLKEAGHRIFLAGGLNRKNVAGAIDAVQPLGVDVASGVEREPGVKDAGALRAFFKEIRT
jgi:phosphoribosylanthranilate isomerase